MTTEEIDYSLPYEEAKKKYGRNGYFMSKDQYEFNKAKAAKEAKMKAAEEAGTNDWWEQEGGPAQKVLQDATGKENPTQEDIDKALKGIAEQRLTKEQQGIHAIGNKGDDHINHPDALDTSEVTKLHNELKSMAQTEENMEPGTWSNTPEQVEEAKNKAGTTKTVPGSTSAGDGNNSDSDGEDTTPKEYDPSGVDNAKKQYNKSMMSIWDAYRNGEISKETAGYFTIDAIATLAKNLGRSIGNVGAQFSGGTIDNGHDESKWGQRQNALLNEEIGKETESLGGAAGRQAESENLDIEAKKIINTYTPEQLERQIEMFKKDLEMADINLDVAHARTDLINYIKNKPDYANNPFKMGIVAYLTQAGAAGAANNASKTLGDAINWTRDLIKP